MTFPSAPVSSRVVRNDLATDPRTKIASEQLYDERVASLQERPRSTGPDRAPAYRNRGHPLRIEQHRVTTSGRDANAVAVTTSVVLVALTVAMLWTTVAGR